jgi:hypothetical protein
MWKVAVNACEQVISNACEGSAEAKRASVTDRSAGGSPLILLMAQSWRLTASSYHKFSLANRYYSGYYAP